MTMPVVIGANGLPIFGYERFRTRRLSYVPFTRLRAECYHFVSRLSGESRNDRVFGEAPADSDAKLAEGRQGRALRGAAALRSKRMQGGAAGATAPSRLNLHRRVSSGTRAVVRHRRRSAALQSPG